MCKRIIVALCLLQGVTHAATLSWVNVSGGQRGLTNGATVWLLDAGGALELPITTNTLAVLSGAGHTVDVQTDWVLREELSGATLERASTVSAGAWGAFASGIGLCLMAGLLGIGARWTRKVIVGDVPE